MTDLHGDVLVALADLDLVAGRGEAARRRAAEAIGHYERKGDVVSLARMRAQL